MWTKAMRLQQRLCRLPIHYRRETAGDRFGELINLSIIKRFGYNPHWVWKKINEEDFDYWIGNCSGGPVPPVEGAIVLAASRDKVLADNDNKVILTGATKEEVKE